MLAEEQQSAAASAIGNTSATQTVTSSASGSPSQFTSIEEWETLWATQRAEIVKTITDNGWGWDREANKVTGPGGFEVDLSSCPDGWDPYQGLENGTIKIGQNLASSGPLADYGNIGVGQGVYYDYVNTQGGDHRLRGKDLPDHQ